MNQVDPLYMSYAPHEDDQKALDHRMAADKSAIVLANALFKAAVSETGPRLGYCSRAFNADCICALCSTNSCPNRISRFSKSISILTLSFSNSSRS